MGEKQLVRGLGRAASFCLSHCLELQKTVSYSLEENFPRTKREKLVKQGELRNQRKT